MTSQAKKSGRGYYPPATDGFRSPREVPQPRPWSAGCVVYLAPQAQQIRAAVHQDLREHFIRRFDVLEATFNARCQDAWTKALTP